VSDNANEPVRIGQILIEQGVLSEQQVFEIAEAQATHRKPFGVLAEEMFDVTVDSIEQAWVEQYARFTGSLDLENEQVDVDVLKLLNRRQAWQFEMLPLRLVGDGELLVAASRHRLARAVTFAAQHIDAAVYFRIADSKQLRLFLQKHYPMPEVSEDLMERARKLAWPGRDEHAA